MPDRILLCNIDIDRAVMCPMYMYRLEFDELYVKTGTSMKQKFILIHSLAKDLGRHLSHELPCLHALSGCDSTSAFCGIYLSTFILSITCLFICIARSLRQMWSALGFHGFHKINGVDLQPSHQESMKLFPSIIIDVTQGIGCIVWRYHRCSYVYQVFNL